MTATLPENNKDGEIHKTHWRGYMCERTSLKSCNNTHRRRNRNIRRRSNPVKMAVDCVQKYNSRKKESRLYKNTIPLIKDGRLCTKKQLP